MPKLKFRHLDKTTGEMLYSDKDFYNLEHFFSNHQYDKSDDMQFTGLTDINGVEIYEGDIYHQGDTRILYEVVFNDDHLGFVGKQLGSGSLAGLRYFQSAIVVVGNIHENQELLEN